ncbi:MAG TPA: hypothetical protein VH008_34745 [Pseudonocardia sp.]|jgi:hypothetical protein|nr:hypothetical protein [Pseudonocardia sp.]
MTDSTGRTVTANLVLTLDGHYSGPAGPTDMASVDRLFLMITPADGPGGPVGVATPGRL